MCKVTNQTPESTALWKFWLVFAVNGGLSVFWKDPALAKIFANPGSKKGPTPRNTFLSWIARDTIHVFGAAVLPDYLEEFGFFLCLCVCCFCFFYCLAFFSFWLWHGFD